MPAQNAFPVPVMIATRVWDFSIVSSAVCSSAIIWVLIALRFSGRLKVMIERKFVVSNVSVSKFIASPLLLCPTVSVPGTQFVRENDGFGQFSAVETGCNTGVRKCRENALRSDVSNQVVPGKRATA